MIHRHWLIYSCLMVVLGGGLDCRGADNALVNLSVNARVSGAGITPGFVVQAGGGRFVVMGESQYHTGEPLPDPVLVVQELVSGQVLAENNNWRDHPTADEVVSAVRAPAGELDAALALTLPPGSYVVTLKDRQGGPGQALVSIQQVEQPFSPATELTGVPCLTLDRQDGAVASEPYPYADWRCQDSLVASDDGGSYRIRLRWNRPGLVSRATLVWLAGEDGRRAHGDFEQGVAGAADDRPLRRRLAEDEEIRSVEVQFIDHPPGQPVLATAPGFWGYWSGERRGYPRVASAYREALSHLHQPGLNLVRGDWTTLVGSSNGATVTAFALAYQDADLLADRVVLFSGPFLTDLGRECRDPGYPAYMGINDGIPGRITGDSIRALVSAWNGWMDCRDGGLDLSGRSLLDPGSRRDYPGLDIALVLGGEDAYGPWLLESSRLWYEAIQARSRSRVVVPGLAHDLWGGSVQTENLLYETLRQAPTALAGMEWADTVR